MVVTKISIVLLQASFHYYEYATYHVRYDISDLHLGLTASGISSIEQEA